MRSALKMLEHPDFTIEKFIGVIPELISVDRDVRERVEIEGRYAPYLEKQSEVIQDYRRDDRLVIPEDLNYDQLSFSAEVAEKLKKHRPKTLVWPLYPIIPD